MELVTATNVTAARSVLKSAQVQDVMISKHSWTEQEWESILAELAAEYPEVTAIVGCMGCIGCDLSSGRAGTLQDKLPLMQLIAAIAAESRKESD
jgi:hypothetical protein